MATSARRRKLAGGGGGQEDEDGVGLGLARNDSMDESMRPPPQKKQLQIDSSFNEILEPGSSPPSPVAPPFGGRMPTSTTSYTVYKSSRGVGGALRRRRSETGEAILVPCLLCGAFGPLCWVRVAFGARMRYVYRVVGFPFVARRNLNQPMQHDATTAHGPQRLGRAQLPVAFRPHHLRHLPAPREAAAHGQAGGGPVGLSAPCPAGGRDGRVVEHHVRTYMLAWVSVG